MVLMPPKKYVKLHSKGLMVPMFLVEHNPLKGLTFGYILHSTFSSNSFKFLPLALIFKSSSLLDSNN